jgi:ADP-heptose:LPS heptosyltransferase
VLLVLRALGLGDLLTAVPALRALADAFPHHRRVLAAPAALRPIAALTGAVDAVADARPLEPIRLGASPDVGVNLHGRGPQSHEVVLATRPRRLVAFEHVEVPRSWGSPRWREDEHEVRRWCRLLAEHGIPADPRRLALEPPTRVAPGAAAGATLVHPGAASPSRRWPVERWATVARFEALAGRRVLVTGSPSERRLAEQVAAGGGLDPSAVLAGRTDLEELASVVASAGLVLSGDTGVAHLATAFGTPSVVLFGPTPPDRWGPPEDRSRHVVLWRGHSGDPHAPTTDPGLLEIGVEDVLDGIGRVRAAMRAPLVGADGGAAR